MPSTKEELLLLVERYYARRFHQTVSLTFRILRDIDYTTKVTPVKKLKAELEKSLCLQSYILQFAITLTWFHIPKVKKSRCTCSTSWVPTWIGGKRSNIQTKRKLLSRFLSQDRLIKTCCTEVIAKVTNYLFKYEPLYVARAETPIFDERFIGFGMTRNTQVLDDQEHMGGLSQLDLERYWPKSAPIIEQTSVLKSFFGLEDKYKPIWINDDI